MEGDTVTTDHPVLFNIVNGGQRHGALTLIEQLPLGTHKVVIAPLSAAAAVRSRFHAMCGDVARFCEFDRRRHAPQQWKVLMISAHAVAQNQPSEVISGLEHELVDIRESTTQMGNPRLLSCVEYVRAYGDMQGVRWSEPALKGIPR
jgi:hypothetical protein